MIRWLPLWLAIAPLHAEVNRSWEVLIEKLKPNEKVVVTRMNSGNVEGKLLGITADDITVRWRGQPQVIRREDVFRVRVADIRKHHTLIGMAIGFGGGAIIGAASASCCRGATAAGVGLFGMGIGAAVGGALPIGEPLYQLEKRR
jgi:hypothetical protein